MAGPSKKFHFEIGNFMLRKKNLLSCHHPDKPASDLDEFKASLIAKSTPIDINKDGSPVAK